MNYGQKMPSVIRDPSPCDGCTERFTACSDCCPKDARGERGYKAWTAEIARVKKAKREYIDRTHVRMKSYNGGKTYGEE